MVLAPLRFASAVNTQYLRYQWTASRLTDPNLTQRALTELGLVPDHVSDAGREGEIGRQPLGKLSGLAHGIVELRGLLGTGHGRGARAVAPEPQQTPLAVTAATAFARYAIDAHRRTPR